MPGKKDNAPAKSSRAKTKPAAKQQTGAAPNTTPEASKLQSAKSGMVPKSLAAESQLAPSQSGVSGSVAAVAVKAKVDTTVQALSQQSTSVRPEGTTRPEPRVELTSTTDSLPTLCVFDNALTNATTTSTDATASKDLNIPEHMIAIRAYHIWKEQGSLPGREHENWARAERELKAFIAQT